jgi:hypothetical protein
MARRGTQKARKMKRGAKSRMSRKQRGGHPDTYLHNQVLYRYADHYKNENMCSMSEKQLRRAKRELLEYQNSAEYQYVTRSGKNLLESYLDEIQYCLRYNSKNAYD